MSLVQYTFFYIQCKTHNVNFTTDCELLKILKSHSWWTIRCLLKKSVHLYRYWRNYKFNIFDALLNEKLIFNVFLAFMHFKVKFLTFYLLLDSTYILHG
jgi:hypothetical protein